MKTRRTFQVLVVAVAAAAGCAAARSTMVPVEPIANGRPSELSRYEVAFAGDAITPSARVFVGAGEAVSRGRGDAIVRVGFRVENVSSHKLAVPIGELFLAQLGSGRVAMTELDGGTLPQAIEVLPGGARSFELAFALPPGVRIDDVRAFALHWVVETADADDSGGRAVGTTELASIERGRVYGPVADRTASSSLRSGITREDLQGEPRVKAGADRSSQRAMRSFAAPRTF
ncbi:MAG TPA: hypothetical protein VFF06_16080 [Polyangia bacterium]|nr:hypothetical protein [Polyangia bacterium]